MRDTACAGDCGLHGDDLRIQRDGSLSGGFIHQMRGPSIPSRYSKLDPCIVDRKLVGNAEEIRLGERTIRAIHIPGHSPGSVAYFTTSRELKIVFAQDVRGPLHPSLLSNADDCQASLQRLIDLDADVLCAGHYGIYKGRQDIVRFVRSFMR